MVKNNSQKGQHDREVMFERKCGSVYFELIIGCVIFIVLFIKSNTQSQIVKSSIALLFFMFFIILRYAFWHSNIKVLKSKIIIYNYFRFWKVNAVFKKEDIVSVEVKSTFKYTGGDWVIFLDLKSGHKKKYGLKGMKEGDAKDLAIFLVNWMGNVSENYLR
jgi:hypothetical protein